MTCGGLGALRGCLNAFLITAAVAAAAAAIAAGLRSHEAEGKGRLTWIGPGPLALARCREAPDVACAAVWRAARDAFLRRRP